MERFADRVKDSEMFVAPAEVENGVRSNTAVVNKVGWLTSSLSNEIER